MSNYEKAITKAKERIEKQNEHGVSTRELERYVMGMKQAFKISEFLTFDEYTQFEDEMLEFVLNL